MGTTQQDIAAHLGVSVATVSRALDNSGKLSPQTRARVVETAAQLGYAPARAHRPAGAAGGRTLAVGILLCQGGSQAASGHLRMIAGICDACEAERRTTMLHMIGEDQVERLPAGDRLPLLQPGQVGGLILLNRFPPPVLDWLATRWPTVVIHHYTPTADVDIVEVDAVDGIGRLVQKLHDLGHRCLGFIADARRHTWSHARHGAFVQAVDALGLDYDPENFLRSTASQVGVAIGELLAERTAAGVTAWVCDHDGLAAGVGAELIACGFAVPERVSVTGFDGEGLLPDGRRLTSVATPFEAIGAAAVRRLLRRLECPQAPRPRILVPGQLVAGETVGPACPEVGGRRSEVRGRRSEVRGQRPEARGQRSELSTLNSQPSTKHEAPSTKHEAPSTKHAQ